jgi:hypothetical protein
LQGFILFDLTFDHHVLEGETKSEVINRVVTYYTHLATEKPPMALIIPVIVVCYLVLQISRLIKFKTFPDVLCFGKFPNFEENNSLANFAVVLGLFVGIIQPSTLRLATEKMEKTKQVGF